jgi:DNA repair exonuclease SbcCD nuclease subunit
MKKNLTEKKKNRIQTIIEQSDYEKGDVCLVTISDQHMTNNNSYGKYNSIGVNSDLEDKFYTMQEAADVASCIGATLVATGDLLDQRQVDGITSDYVSRWINHLMSGMSDFILLGGNHEYNDTAANFSTLKHYKYFCGLNSKGNKGIIATENTRTYIEYEVGKGIFFSCLPANKKIEHSIKEEVKWFQKNKDRLDKEFPIKVLPVMTHHIMLLHGGIEGADLGSMKAPDGISATLIETCAQLYDWVVCGDFHKFQFVNDLKNVYYCGAPKQMNLGDVGQKRGYQILNLTKETVNFIQSESPTFKIIEMVCGEYIHPWIKNSEKYKDRIQNKIVVVKITGTQEDVMKVNYTEIRKELLKFGAFEVYKEVLPIKEKRNSIRINKDLPIKQIMAKYVESKDYELDEFYRKKHLNILYSYVKDSNDKH